MALRDGEARSHASLAVAVGVAASAGAAALMLRRVLAERAARRRHGADVEPLPCAWPWLPLLGNALAYKGDPSAFLERQRRQLGDVFLLDLAGLRIAVVSGRQEMMQAATAAESALSARAAAADFGFGMTLGDINVYFGTDLHRMVLKETGIGAASPTVRSSLERAVAAAADEALPREGGVVPDAFAALRRMSLHAVLLHLVGKEALRVCDAGLRERRSRHRDFLSWYMAFQDMVEDATAKGIALPSCVAQLLVHGPVRTERHRLQRALATALEEVWGAEGHGEWLRTVQAFGSRGSIPAWRRYLERSQSLLYRPPPADEPIGPEDAAELIVGLLFAAHKNPAIGAAQTLALLLEHPEEHRKVVAELGSGAEPQALRRSLQETLRLTAHALGAIRRVVAHDGVALGPAGGRRFHVPRGCYVAMSHVLPNRNPWVFEDPFEFRPDRFADGQTFDDYQLTTFSHGLHKCPGRAYAMAMMELMLSEVFRRYDTAPVGKLPPIDFTRATLAQRAGPCALKLTPRAGAQRPS